MRNKVPNQFPKHSFNGIAFVGEAPGYDEVQQGQPFVGAAGRLLTAIMAKVGINRDACYIGNLCQEQPEKNDFDTLTFHQVEEGVAQLSADLLQLQPNIIVCLGKYPLHRFNGTDFSIGKFRGSLFRSNLNAPLPNTKCLATYHPAAVLRTYPWIHPFGFDLKKANRHSTTPDLILPQRKFEIELTAAQLCEKMDNIPDHSVISIDIEGWWDSIECISIALNEHEAFIVPFAIGQTEYWNEHDWIIVMQSLANLLKNPSIGKILQNGLYDAFCLQYAYKMPVLGIVEDTMLKHWELFCELPKALDFQASIYTDEPYYKNERGSKVYNTLLEYCCKDTTVTYEISKVTDELLHSRPKSFEHYRFNVDMLAPLLYMELRGIKYDAAGAVKAEQDVMDQLFARYYELHKVASIPFLDPRNTTFEYYIKHVAARLCMKKAAPNIRTLYELKAYAKKANIEAIEHITEVLQTLVEDLTDSDVGKLIYYTGEGVNVNSSQQCAVLLYESLLLPRQYKIEQGKKTDKVTTDVKALLTLVNYAKDYKRDILVNLLYIRRLETSTQTLRIQADEDGRVRCGYNLVGTETGRLSCNTSPTGSGYNLQTIPKGQRHLFRADDGYEFFQCDLAGADGWTVACRCAALGDSTMLDDYLYGLKPAKIIALMNEFGEEVNSWDRAKIKQYSKTLPNKYIYMASKRVQHGTNYGMKPRTMAMQVAMDAFKYGDEIIPIDPDTCERLQRLYLSRYSGILRWHRQSEENLQRTGKLESASGHTRQFMNRLDAHDTLKEYLAHEPQINTTYATNKAASRLWADPENRNSDGSLIIQPLHQVHDALCGQWPQDRRDWAIGKVRTYFNNPITIAGITITIPFDGGYGPSWGEIVEGTI